MPKRKALPRLTDRGRELISYVLNAAAFGTHGDDAELETMAKKLGTTAGRLRRYATIARTSSSDILEGEYGGIQARSFPLLSIPERIARKICASVQ